MFLLSNLAFAAGGGAAAGEGDMPKGEGDMPKLDDMVATEVFFNAEYPLDLELGSPEELTAFVKQRKELQDLCEQMNQISMQVEESVLGDQSKLVELFLQYLKIRANFFEASKIRLAVLKQLAEERKIELKPLPEGMVSENSNIYYNNQSLDFQTTRRELFHGHLLLGDSFFNSFEKVAEELEKTVVSGDFISSVRESLSQLLGYFKEFKDKNPEYKTVLAQKFILNDFTVIDLFLEMNQLILKIDSASIAFIQKCREKFGPQVFERFTKKSFLFTVELRHYVSPFAKKGRQRSRGMTTKKKGKPFVVEGLLKREQD